MQFSHKNKLKLIHLNFAAPEEETICCTLSFLTLFCDTSLIVFVHDGWFSAVMLSAATSKWTRGV